MDSQLSPATGNPVSEAVIDQLARTKGWTRFFSVMLWIGTVFLLLGGLVLIAIGMFGSSFAGAAGAGMPGGAEGLILGIVYFVMAFFYIYPALRLGKYSSRIQDLIQSPSQENLVTALNEQRAFWKFMGILMIVIIALYIVAIPVIIVVSAASSGAFSAL